MINLYSPDNTDFTKNGNATLIPIRADLKLTLNGSWSLELEVPYDREGRWELIEEGAVIVSDINCIRELTATRQRFRIYDYKKGLRSVTAIAFPVAMESTHDAPIDNLILNGLTGIQAMAQLQTKTNKYTLNSDITRTGSTSFSNTNINNAIASGSEGCFIDVWGGEIVYDNLKFSVLERVGNNQPAKHKILYGKDLTDIQYEKDDSGLITRIYPISQDGIRLNGSGYVDSSKASQYPIIHSRYMTAPYKLIEDNISSSTATAQLTASIKSQIQTLASTLSHSVYNTAVSQKVEIEYIKKIKSDIISAVQSMATANIIQADANRVMQSAIASGMEWLKDVAKAEWTWHGSDSTGWWYGSSTSDRATSEYEYIDRIWRYFGDNSLWQKPRDDGSGNWDWIQENSGKRYGNNMKYFAQNTYVFITMSGQMKEYWFDKEGWYDSDKSGDSDYAWHGDGSSGNPYWFGDDSTTGKYLKDGWWFIDGTYYYFDSEGYWDNTTTFDNYQWDWIEDGDNWWFGNPDKNFARTYVTNQWLKLNGDWYRFDNNGYAVGDLTLENEVVARFTSGMAQLKTLCESLYTQAYNLLYSQMRSYCTKLFNTGIDVPSVTITVNMADLSNTSEYEDYQQLTKIYLGDSVTAIDYKHGISAVERIVSITYDCIRKVNSSVQIGVASSSLSDILKTSAGGSVAGGFDTSIIESTLTSHGNSIASLQSSKQDKLTAGDGIEINNNVISATGGDGIDVLYGTTTPSNSSGDNKDFYLRMPEEPSDVLSQENFGANSTSSYPIYLESFSRTDRNDFDFAIKGYPSDHGAGENCWFDLAGLVEGKTYTVSFDMQFNSGATFPNIGYYDRLEICDTTIIFESDTSLHTYTGSFTYTANGQAKFLFHKINDRTYFTSTFTNFVISGDFTNDEISEIYNKHEGEWIKYTPPTMSGASSSEDGTSGLVPQATIADKDKFLKGDGTWATPDGASAVSDLTDVTLLSLTDGQILKYNSSTQKWENANESGGGGGGNGSTAKVDVLFNTPTTISRWADPVLVSCNVDNYDEFVIETDSTESGISHCINFIPSAIPQGDTSGTEIVQYKTSKNTLVYINHYNGGIGIFTDTGTSLTINKVVGIKYGGDYYSPIIYSTEEREVGVWTDNKPLYQKTFIHDTSVPYRTWTTIADTGANTKIINYDGLSYIGGIPFSKLNYHRGSDSSEWTCSFVYNNHEVQLNQSVSGVTITAKVTVWYTKDADTAGSGSYNTLGVPTVHYDGSEQVIGTWFGETLYQRSYSLGALTRDSSWHSTAHGISNLKRAINVSGYVRQSSDGRMYSIPHYRPSNNQGISVGADATYIYYMNTWLEYASEAYVTIQYTKTS